MVISVRVPESGVCVYISGEDCVWYVCDVLYAVLYVRISSFIARICAVSRRYIHVCNCDMFTVVKVYINHLKFCVVCIDGRMYICCSECNVVSNEPTSCRVQPIGTHGGEVVYFGCVCFWGDLGFMNYDDICMCVVNKQFKLPSLFLIPFMFTCSIMDFSHLCLAQLTCYG